MKNGIKQKAEIKSTNIDEQKKVTALTTNIVDQEIFEKFSSFSTLQRIIAI